MQKFDTGILDAMPQSRYYVKYNDTFGRSAPMAMKRCPVCGEKYSDTYKNCPFCEEEEALRRGRKVRPQRRETGLPTGDRSIF